MQHARSKIQRTQVAALVAGCFALVASCGSDDAADPATTGRDAAPATSQQADATTTVSSTSPPVADTTIAVVVPGGLDYGYGDDGGAATTAEETETSAAGTTGAPAVAPALVEAADTSLGRILVTNGLTLYAFTPDEGQSGSTCTGDCAGSWPPLLVEGELVVGSDLDRASFGTIDRDDGTEQVTFAGRPLYRFAADSAAGDVNGQGVGGVWFAVAPDGALVRET